MARGFFAEWTRQSRIAQREEDSRERESTRHYESALRRARQARRAEERADRQL